MKCALYTAYCTLNTAHCTRELLLCTLHTEKCTLDCSYCYRGAYHTTPPLGHSGTQWDTVGHSGTQWDTPHTFLGLVFIEDAVFSPA